MGGVSTNKDGRHQRFSSRIPRPHPPSTSSSAEEATADDSPHPAKASRMQHHNLIQNNNSNNNNSDRNRESRLLCSPQSNREAPWLKDQRQAPRSVRTSPPYNKNSQQKELKQQHNRNRNKANNFDSPSTIANESNSNCTVATPASRNPSPTENISASHLPTTCSNITMYHARNSNPFDSIGGVMEQNNNTTRTTTTIGRTNLFDSPTSTPQQRYKQNKNQIAAHRRARYDEFDKYNYPDHQENNKNVNPFDTSSSDESPPKVRVTVHTEQNAPPTPNQQHQYQHQQKQQQLKQRQRLPYREVRKVTNVPFSPISSTCDDRSIIINKQDPSVALDSLEQILDTTEETIDEDEDQEDGIDHGDVEYDYEDDKREQWPDDPYFQHHQHQQNYFQQQQHQQLYPHPHPPPATPTTPTPSYFSSSSQTAGSNTPSEKALIAAESLRKSFEHRRRQKKTNIATTTKTTTLKRIDNARMMEEIDNNKAGSQQQETSIMETEVDNAFIVAANRKKNFGRAATGSVIQNPAYVLDDLKSGVVIADAEKRSTTANDVDESFDKDEEQPQQQQHYDSDPVSSNTSNDNNYALHDLCDEAISTDDLAWYNALFLLSVRPDLGHQSEPECMMTPLHVACLAQEPPPVWMTRGLLYAAPETCRQTDEGGRLPLHLLVATSAHIDTIRLLVDEYPPSVSHKDDRGFTPLQLLLKRNDPIHSGLTLEHLRVLLGQQQSSTTSTTNSEKKSAHRRRENEKFSFRKGDHLKSSLKLEDLDVLAEERENRHESMFQEYPDTVRRALNKLSQWKRRQINKNRINRSDEENKFLESREADFVNPASIATPAGHLLPLHLLVRKPPQNNANQDITSVKKASIVDLLRVLIAAYPQGLVGVDANGKTPIMTAMLQTDSSPSEEVIELLLGLRTLGFDGMTGMERPALIPSGDTLQLPLHVAAEELLSNYSLLSTICEAFPDARKVQDIRGRTPLHLAFQNYRSVPVDEATLELLFIEPVARIKDNDGKTLLDLLLKNPQCIIRNPPLSSSMNSTKYKCNGKESQVMILQEFFDASIEKPRNRRETQNFITKFQNFPPWLRRQACAARFVQNILVEEMASPFTTFRILGSGFVLILLLVALRRMLHVNTDYAFLIYYLATYHCIMQLIHWGTSIYMGECFRLCITNLWRWFDLATVILSIWCAIYVSRENNDNDGGGGGGSLLSPLGASATIACWLSLLGYMIEWCCGLAVFIGSATQLLSILIWPLCVAVMGFFATSQVLFTLEDCTTGGICSLSESYMFVYWLVLGVPVLTDTNYEISTGMSVIIVIFTILCLWWIMSVIAMIVTEANRLDRQQLSLTWYWEPKVILTATALAGGNNEKVSDSQTYVNRYCDTSEKFWHIFVTALRGEQSEIHWDSYCFRSQLMVVFTGFLALFLLPIWLILGLITLGLLWPPQIRRGLFCPRTLGSTIFGSRRSDFGFPYNNIDDLSRIKLSRLRSDVIDLKAVSYDQNHRIQKDLGLIKEIIFRATMGSEEYE